MFKMLNPKMDTIRTFFLQNRVVFYFQKKEEGRPPPLLVAGLSVTE